MASPNVGMTDTQQMIYGAFNSQVYVSDRMDVQSTPLYDTVTLAAGATVSTLSTALFTNVGAASGKTLAQTNMTQSQKLPAPEAFSVFGFRLRWQENVYLPDLYTILANFAFSFYLGQKRYQLGPLWYYNAGGGIAGSFTTGGTSVLTNGTAGSNNKNPREINIVIDNQASFYGIFDGAQITLTAGASGGTGMVAMMLLDGFHARGVQ
jgi:hypothetical protein